MELLSTKAIADEAQEMETSLQTQLQDLEKRATQLQVDQLETNLPLDKNTWTALAPATVNLLSSQLQCQKQINQDLHAHLTQANCLPNSVVLSQAIEPKFKA